MWTDLKSRLPARPDAFVYLAFLFLTIVLSVPAIFHLSTHVIGYQGDIWQYPLNLFLFRDRVLAGNDPYFTDFVFHPPGTSLLLHNYTELHDVIGLALHPFLNELATSNLLLLASTFLTAAGTYKLAMELYGNRTGAAFAAIAFAFCPNRIFRSFSQAHMALTQWLPYALWAFLKLAETKRWRYMWLTVLFSTLTCYTNYYFAVYLALAFLLLLLYGLPASAGWRSMRFLGMLAATAAITILFLAPIARRFWIDRQENAVSSFEDLDFAVQKSADLSDYVKIGSMNPYIKNALSGTILQPHSINTTGWVVLSLSLIGIYFAIKNRQKNLKTLLFMGFAFLLFSLGPFFEFKLGGSTWQIFLPDYLLMKAPVLNNVRFPARFSVMVALPLALAAGYAMTLLTERLKQRSRKTFVAAAFLLLLIELSPAPIPMKALDPPAVFAAIAKEPYESMLTIPYFPGVGRFTDNMRYILAHHKKIMEGKIARTPKVASEYLIGIPLAHSLYQMTIGERLETRQAGSDRRVSPFFQSFFDTHYLTVFPPFSGKPQVRNYVQTVFPGASLLSTEKDILVYRLTPGRGVVHLEASDPNIRFVLYENWKWSDDGSMIASNLLPRLILPSTTAAETLEFEMTLQSDPPAAVTFVMNRQELLKQTVGGTPQNVLLRIEGSALRSSGRVVTLQSNHPGLRLLSIDYKFSQ